MSWYHDAFGGHYSSLYAHRDSAEAERCIDMLAQRLDPPPGPVLDLGCGAGRHLPRMAAAGWTGVGLDLSAALLAEAGAGRGALHGAFSLVRADMRNLPLRDAAFAAVLSLFTAFGYFGSVPAHGPLLQEIARVLRPGGLWVLDFLNSRRVRAELSGGRKVESTRIAGPLGISESRYLADNQGQVRKDVVLEARPGQAAEALAMGIGPEGLRYTESVALFEPQQIRDLAAAAGLAPQAAFGDYGGTVLDETNSPRWIMVFRLGSDHSRS